jgi:hypothetical protein
MRLQRFLNDDLLLEKVSKKDISDMLNSTDVIVGAEFEFMTHFLEAAQTEYDDAYNTYTAEMDAVYAYNEELAEWYNTDEEDRDDPPNIPYELKEYGYEPGQQIPEPDEPYGIYNVDNNDDDWEKCVEDYFNTYKPPFSSFEVTADHGKDVYDDWVIEQDGSLGSYGVEVKSPPMTLKEFTDVCPKMFAWIDKHGYTDKSCGFHIHMSIKSVPDLTKNLDLVKLTMFTDEDYIYKFFPDRIGNTYTDSMKRKLSSQGNISPSDWSTFINTKKMINRVGESHYNAINWEGLSDDKQHIEFRYMGSSDYHKKWNNIKVIIAQYAYNLNLACNPKSHMKEYARKISRMINKIEKERYRRIINYLNMWLLDSTKYDDIVLIIEKYIKKYDVLYKNLKDIYVEFDVNSLNIDVTKDVESIRADIFRDYKKSGGKVKTKKFEDILSTFN